MTLTTQDVQRVAFLSRLELTEAEIAKFQDQLSHVLEYIKVLDELDTSAVEPTLSITGQANRLRTDENQPSFSQSEALKNGKNTTDQYFIAPYVFE